MREMSSEREAGALWATVKNLAAMGTFSAGERHNLTYVLMGSLWLLGREWSIWDQRGSREACWGATDRVQSRGDGGSDTGVAAEMYTRGRGGGAPSPVLIQLEEKVMTTVARREDHSIYSRRAL